jgi:hypothetical protein
MLNIRCDILSTDKRLEYYVYRPRLHLYFPDKYQEKYNVICNPLGINIIVVCTVSVHPVLVIEVPSATQI